MTIPMKDIPTQALQDLERVKEQFALWRGSKRRGERITEGLWAEAAALYPRFSVHQISRALRMDFVGLRERLRIGAAESAAHTRQAASPFIELARPVEHHEVATEHERLSSCRISVKIAGKGQVRIVIRKAASGVAADVLRVLSGWL